MSDTIDRRVVEMRFDNQQFESRTRTTLGTLEKLKNALNFSHASDGLDKLNKSVGNMNLNPLRSAVDGVQVSFSKLEAMAMTALVNITNRAVDAGVALAKNLTIDQLSAGWQKYADKTSAVQTIMAATAEQFTDTGEQMDFVNAQLDRLNWFTDETSYNFVDMVGNIGKFTANGVALDDAATAMQGIATWAAVSGGNASTASRAMYQLSQAMGMGAVKLQDWMSIETANMATYEFKEMALETAVSLGILEKQAEGTYKSIETGNEITVKGFRESLKEGWFSSDVLVKVLNQYGGFTNKLYEISEATGESATDLLQWIERYRDAGTNTSEVIQSMANETGLSVQDLQGYMTELTDDMYSLGEKAFRAAQEAKTFGEAIDATKDAVSTGWMQTFEIIFGDYEEARVRWTALANELWDIFASGAEARNELLEEALGLPESLVQKQTSGWAAIQSAVEAAGIPLDDFIQKCLELGGKGGEGITSIENFKKSLSEGWLTKDIVSQAIDSFIGPVEQAGEVTETVGHTFEDFKRIIDETWRGDWGVGQDRWKAYADAGWDADAMQQAVNKSAQGLELTMDDYQACLVSVTDEQLKSAGYTDEQIEQLRTLQETYSGLGGSITDVEGSTEGLRTGSELLFDGISKGWNAIKGIFSAMKAGWDIAFPPMTASRLYEILEAFNSVANRFNDWVGNWDDSEGTPISETVSNIADTVSGLGAVLGIGLDAIKETAGFLSDVFGPSVTDAIDKVLEFTAKVGRYITSLRTWIRQNSVVRKGLEFIREEVYGLIQSFTAWFSSFEELPLVQRLVNGVEDLLSSFGKMVEKIFPNATKRISELWNMLNISFQGNTGFTGIIVRLKNFADALKIDILGAWEQIKQSDVFGSIARGIESVVEAIKTLDPNALTDWAKSAWKGITSFFQPIIDFLALIKGKLLGYADGINSGFQSIGDVLSDAASYLRDHVGSIIAVFALLMGARSIYKFLNTLIGIAKAITAPVQTIVSAFSGFTAAAKGLGKALNGLAIVEAAGAIAGLAWVAVKLGEVPTAQLFKGIFALGLITVFVVALIEVVSELFKAKSKLNESFVKGQVSGMFKMVELAGAVALLATAFEKVVNVIKTSTADQLKTALYGIIGAVGVLFTLSIVIGKFGGKSGANIAAPMVAIGISVYIIAAAFQDIMDALYMVPESRIKNAEKIIAGLIVGVGIISVLLGIVSKLGGNMGGSSLKIGGSVLAVAGAIKLLVSAFNDILTTPIENLSGGKIGLIIGIIAAIGAIMIALSKMPASAGMSGIGLFAVAASVEILAIAIRTMGTMESDDIGKGIMAIGALLIFMGLFTLLTKSGSKLGAKSALVFIGLSVAILILVGAIAALSLLKEEDVVLGTAAISAMIVAVGIMMFLSSIAGDLNTGHFIGLAIVIGVLAAAVVALGLLDPSAVAIGATAMSAMLTACGIMMLLMSAAKGMNIAPFVGLILVIGVLAGAIALLSKMDPAGVIVAASALSEVIVVCGIMMALSRIAKGLDVGPFAGLALVVAAIAISIGALALLPADGLQAAASALESVMVVFSIMSVVLGLICKKMGKDIDDAMPVLGALVLVLGGVALVIWALTNNIQNPLAAMAICDSLAVLFFSLGGTFKAVAALGQTSGMDGKGGTSLLKGILGVIAVITIMGGLLVLLGSVFSEDQIADINDRMQRAVPLFQTIGSAIGGIINGLLTSLFSIDLSGLFDQLSQFGAGVKQMATDLSGVTFSEGAVSAIKSVGAALLYLAGADILNALTSLFGGSTSSFSTAFDGLAEFGTELKNFGANLEGVNADNITAGANAAEALSKFQSKLPRSGGLIQKLIGEPANIQSFGEQMVAFGAAIIEAAGPESFGGVTEEDCNKIAAGAAAAQAVADVQKALPASGGLVQKIIGEPATLKKFGAQMKSLARSVKIASGEEGFGGVSEDDCTKIESAATAVQSIVDVQNALPETGGIVQKIIGEPSSMKDFGEQMAALANSVYFAVKGGMVDGVQMKGFGDLTSEELESIEDATTYVQKIIDLQSQLGDDSGILSKLFGGPTTIDDFGSQLARFATALVNFTSAETGLGAVTNWSVVDTALASVQSIFDLSNNNDLPTISTNLLGAVEAISAIGSAIGTGGWGTTGFYGAVQNVDTDKLSTVITEIGHLISVMNTLESDTATKASSFGDSLSSLAMAGIDDFCAAFDDSQDQVVTAVTGFLTAAQSAISEEDTTFQDYGEFSADYYAVGFSGEVEAAKNAASIIIDTFITALSDAESKYTTEGETSVKNYIDKFQNQYRTAKTTGETLASNVLTGLAKYARDFSEKGKNAGSSYVAGIGTYKKLAYHAGAALGSNALSGVNVSDSARTYGNNFSIGFINGIKGYGTQAYNAAYSLGRNAVSGLKTAIDSSSPSKEAQKSGDYFGIGFTASLLNWIGKAGSAATELGQEAVNSLNDAIAKIPSLLSEDMNLDPIVRPVIDLSNAQQSISTLNGMFNKSVSVAADVAAVTGTAVNASKVRVAATADEAGQTSRSEDQRMVNQYNTFNITSDNPEEVANRVSYILQKQVERKNALWAR